MQGVNLYSVVFQNQKLTLQITKTARAFSCKRKQDFSKKNTFPTFLFLLSLQNRIFNEINLFQMNRIITLDEFIIHRQMDFPYASGELTGLLRDIGVAAKIVNREVN